MSLKVLIAVFFMGISTFLFAQQLDKIGKKGGITLNGGVGANAGYFVSDNFNPYLNSYNYIVSGNLNLSLYGLSVPMSFSYSDAKISHSGQPLNIIGLSPSYKSLTLHLGHRNMSFSNLTLAGHQFFGVGVEWSYKNLDVSAMYGRLLEAIDYDSTYYYAIPTFERMGSGAMVQYHAASSSVKAIAFYAKDNEFSLGYVPSFLNLTPQQNMVYSLGFDVPVNDFISWNLEGALSAWTRDITDKYIDDPKLKQQLFLIQPNITTQYYNAFSTNLDFSFEKFSTGVYYERIEPGYKTLGAYYTTNDMENISLYGSTSFFDNFLDVYTSLGLQRDDLDDSKVSKMISIVFSTDLTFNFSEKFNLTTSYSTYNCYIKVKPIDEMFVQNTVYDQLDTMNYIQINQSVFANARYSFINNDDVSHSTNFNINYQRADSEQGNTRFGTDLASAVWSFNSLFKQSGLNLGANINSNISYYDNGESFYAGAGLSAGIPLFNKKLNANLGVNCASNYQNKEYTALLYSLSNSYSYKLLKSHSFTFSLRYTGRDQILVGEFGNFNKNINEFMGSIGYSYSFDIKRKEKPEME